MKLKPILTLLLVVINFSPISAIAESSTTSIKIGVVIALSGDFSSWGETFRNASLMALESLPEMERKKIEIYFEDDQGQPKNTVAAFNKLVNYNKIDLLITGSSATSNAVAPLAEKLEIIHVAIATDPKLSSGRKYVMNFWLTAEDTVKPLVDELVKRNVKKLARITTVHDGFLIVKEAFDEYNDKRLNFALDQDYPGEIKDFKPFLNKLKQDTRAEGLVMFLVPGQAALCAKQARELGIKMDLIGLGTMEDEKEVKLSADALVGAWYSTEAVSPEFLATYKSKFPESSSFAAGAIHDATLLVAAAVSAGNSRNEVNHFLHNVKNFKGRAFASISASGDNRFKLPVQLKQVATNGFEVLNQ